MYEQENRADGNNRDSETKFKNPATKFSAFCFEWLESIVQAIIVVVFLMTFLFRIVSVNGTSMLETLHHADKVVVWKFNYVPTDSDVVVISRGQNLDEPLIKRVIATEGQTLSIDFSDGSVTVDGVKLNETYIKEKMWLQGDADIPSVVPKGYCFVMGDNRNHSADSRFKEVGLIANENVIGKATFIIFPFDRIGAIK
jgi:signal peptidase I